MSLSRLFPEYKLMKSEFMDPFEAISHNVALPRMDVIESKKGYTIRADVPGFSKDQIDINVRGDMVSIKGNQEKVEEHNDEHYHSKERFQSSFSRSLTLPFAVHPEKIKANIKGGVLEINIPKDEIKSSKVPISA
jgi:HSP20 family protein